MHGGNKRNENNELYSEVLSTVNTRTRCGKVWSTSRLTQFLEDNGKGHHHHHHSFNTGNGITCRRRRKKGKKKKRK